MKIYITYDSTIIWQYSIEDLYQLRKHKQVLALR
jgi:hypothetical protein